MSALLTLEGVNTFYGPIQALKNVDIVVNEGEIVTLIGANGAGKSTLMMTICGSPQARSGRKTTAQLNDSGAIRATPTALSLSASQRRDCRQPNACLRGCHADAETPRLRLHTP